MKKFTLVAIAGLLLGLQQLYAQNVGVNTNTPITSLDVNGAYSARFSSATAGATITIPTDITLFRILFHAATDANVVSVTTPQDGQFLTIINEDNDPATFGSFTIAASGGIGSFIYVGANAAWDQASNYTTTTPFTAGKGLSWSGSTLNSNWTLDGSNNIASNNTSGKVGINMTPLANLDVNGNANVSSGYFYGGTSAPSDLELTRNLPNTVGNCIDIGSFTITNGAHNIRIAVTIANNSFSEAKTYVVPVTYNATANVYQILVPSTNTGASSGNDFATDISVNNNVVSFRLRRTAGTTDGSIAGGSGARVRIESVGSSTDVFTASSSVTTPTAPTVSYSPTSYSSIPSGVIVMWSGTYGNIPGGWALCDGTNGTPNLLSSFIFGVSASPYTAGQINTTGGASTVTLTTTQLPAHTHTGTTDPSTPTFTGTAGSTSSVTPTFTGTAGSTSSVTPTFTGTAGQTTSSVTPTFTGTAGQTTSSVTPTFTGTAGQTTSSVTPTFTGTAGTTNSVTPTFTGTAGQTTSSVTPTFTGTAGSTSSVTPTFTGTAATTGATQPTFTGTASQTTSAGSAHSHTLTTVVTSSAGAHTHNLNTTTNYSGGGTRAFYGDNAGGGNDGTTTSAGAHTHTLTGSTDAESSHTHTYTASGTVSSHTHSFTATGMISAVQPTFTPTGTISVVQPTFTATGTISAISHTFTPAGTISAVQPTFTATGTISAVQPTFTTTGTISAVQPTFTATGTVSTVGPLSFTPGGTISTVGPLTYTPTGTVSSHTHTFTTNSTGTGSPFSIMPPYYTLAYIMKL